MVVPEKWREKLLSELQREHPGICKMKGITRSYFWWPGLDKNIERITRCCLECQAVKKSPPTGELSRDAETCPCYTKESQVTEEPRRV